MAEPYNKCKKVSSTLFWIFWSVGVINFSFLFFFPSLNLLVPKNIISQYFFVLFQMVISRSVTDIKIQKVYMGQWYCQSVLVLALLIPKSCGISTPLFFGHSQRFHIYQKYDNFLTKLVWGYACYLQAEL